ncbi:hypothetical protein B0A50_04091 [Salinomyces thailandicus]|uniref:Transcription elongation factor n=1 Tax=Salinomyces thailandicus TaxID=706561 RepID=A0A4U0TZT4_9PEZI|nr:hypothetical protein B0A50_04091 [Salinomyces thailandica]
MATTMDAKQLADAGKQIMKAADSGDTSTTLLQLLQPLQTVKVSEDLLRSSKIGVAVNKLRQNKDPKVGSLAGQLINKWKQDVNAAKKGKNGSPAPAKAVTGAVTGRDATSSPAPGAGKMEGVKPEAKRKSTIAPEKRNAKADEVDTEVTGNQVRDGCVALMYNGLAFMSSESPDDVLNVSRGVELAAYEQHNQETSQTYKQKMRSLFQNLKMKGNDDLRKGVFSGEITPKKFVTMTNDELKSAEKRAQDAALEKENMSKAMQPEEVKAISTTMTCGKCRQSRVAYSQAQTRSADEPMTTFCECTNCGNRWKFS